MFLSSDVDPSIGGPFELVRPTAEEDISKGREETLVVPSAQLMDRSLLGAVPVQSRFRVSPILDRSEVLPVKL